METQIQRCKGRAGNRSALLACLLAGSSALAMGHWQEPASIRAAAEAAARARIGDTGGEVTLRTEPLDPRLRLPPCEVPLVGEVPDAGRATSRITARVRCPGASPWRLFVPVSVSVRKPLVVAAVPLERGKVLAAGDVILASREVGAAPAGYLTTLESAIGQVLRRNVPAGTVLAPGLLDAPVLVERGRQVTLEARSGGIVVQMAGIAKADGTLGETIPVENLSSRKVLQGIVRSEKSVEVLVP